MFASTTPTAADAFIGRWSRAEASERANAQLFLSELCDLLEVPRPSNTHADGYTFEYPVKIPLGDGSLGDGRIDLYRRDALRNGHPLTSKEKTIHDQGLVSVLRQLHDDLDAAVATAYGWGAGRDLSDEEILTRLVALNAERATEEAEGIIRYLRPEYQNPKGTSATQSGLKLTKGKTVKSKASKTSSAKTPWPKSLAERVRAVEEALRASSAPLSAETLAKTFARASTPDIQEILDTLVTLGRVHQREDVYFQ